MGNDSLITASSENSSIFQSTDNIRPITMRSLFLVFLATISLASFVAGECTLDDIIRCEREIETAINDCLSIGGIQDIQTCINDILAATDCQKCLCEVISDPFLCPTAAP